jgi:hypothetical protein
MFQKLRLPHPATAVQKQHLGRAGLLAREQAVQEGEFFVPINEHDSLKRKT